MIPKILKIFVGLIGIHCQDIEDAIFGFYLS